MNEVEVLSDAEVMAEGGGGGFMSRLEVLLRDGDGLNF